MPTKTNQSLEALQRYTNTGDPYAAQQQWASWDPIQQNRAIINDSRNNRTNTMGLSEWQDYDAVLQGRGTQMARPNVDLRSSLPAGYTDTRLDEELSDFANTGRISGGGMQQSALEGFRGAAGMKPKDRAEIAGQVRRQMMPGGRMI